MQMTTFKLIIFRFFNHTICRFDRPALLFKKLLIGLLVRGKKVPYSPSSRFFSWQDIEDRY